MKNACLLTPKHNVVIEVIQEKDQFASIKNQWDRLAETFGHPLFGHAWYLACADAFYADGDLRVVVLRSQDEIIAAAPLAVRKKNGLEYLELLGSFFLYEPSGLLYQDTDSLTKLLKHVLQLRRPLVLQRLTCFPNHSSLFGNMVNLKAIPVRRSTAASAFLTLGKTWDAFWETLKSRRRYDFRRARRQAEKYGSVRTTVHTPSASELGNLLHTAFVVESAGWKGRSGSALVKNACLQRFFEIYADLACKQQTLRLCFLHIGDSPAAMQIGLHTFNRFWLLKIGYDEKWGDCSPGMQLMNETIRYSLEHGLETYEFLGSEEKWIQAWPVEKRSYLSLGLYPFGAKGLLGLGRDMIDFARKRVQRQ